MAKVYVVGGIANDAIKDMFKHIKEIDIIGSFSSVSQLTDDVIHKGVSFLHLAKAVLVLDYGFSSENHVDRAKEFVLLQDALNSSNLDSTKLYLATKDSNLYVALQQGEGGMPGLLYLYTEVMLLRGEYVPKTLNDIIQGRHDLTGLYHPEVVRVNKVSRMEDDRDTFIAESKTVDNEILHYGKDEPISPFSQKDFVDSPLNEAQARKREQDNKKQEKLQKLKEKQGQSSNVPEQPQVQIQMTSQEPSVHVQVQPKHATEEVTPIFTAAQSDADPNDLDKFNLELMKESFQKRMQHSVLSDKIMQDSGLVMFTGTEKSGTSGVLANVADIYALAKRQVLIIDLDIETRMQTVYFPQYQERVDEYKGTANSLLQVIKGGAIPTNAVQLTSRISLLGLSKSEQIQIDWWDTLETRLYDVLTEAIALYDLVLVDVPMHLMPACQESIDLADKVILTTRNKFYEVDTLVERLLPQLAIQLDETVFVDFLHKTAIWINGYDVKFTDKKGYVLNKVWVRNKIRQLGYPYDLLQILGETPVYENWESQFYTGTRYIWQDRVALGVYQQLLTKVVW